MSTGRPSFAKPAARQQSLARGMRKAMTEAEKRLWWELRRRVMLRGSHFRRQVCIGPYIADFCCMGARLIVEVDGGQHYTDDGAEKDAVRTQFLEQQGFAVIRFTNSAVLQDIDCVIETIAARLSHSPVFDCGAPPTPDPSPQGGGEEARKSELRL